VFFIIAPCKPEIANMPNEKINTAINASNKTAPCCCKPGCLCIFCMLALVEDIFFIMLFSKKFNQHLRGSVALALGSHTRTLPPPPMVMLKSRLSVASKPDTSTSTWVS
jgi:hypothetical protein